MPLPVVIKRPLRPLAHALRRAGRRLDLLLRPAVPWDGRHHPVLERFPPWSGEADGNFVYDSLGIRTDPRFRPQFRAQPRGPLALAHPPPHSTYFELVFLLESVLEPGVGPFRVMELGAGFGTWLVAAHRAMDLAAGRPVELVGVEMVPRHVRWMAEHFRNNGIDPEQHTLIHAAISDCDGEALYEPEPDRRLDFGQRVVRRFGGRAPNSYPTSEARTTPTRVRVASINLRRLLAELPALDLLHVDIQGEELRALSHAFDEIQRGTRRLIVGTHSRRIHRALRRLLREAGWIAVYDFDYRSRARTAFGHVQFLDGMLAYRNPRPVGGDRTADGSAQA